MNGYCKTILGALALACVSLSACSTVEPGVSNTMGTIEALVEAQPDAVIAAAETAVKDLQLELVSSKATKLDGTLEARTARDERVTVRAERVSDQRSNIAIRVGHWGDEATSLLILDKVRENLE